MKKNLVLTVSIGYHSNLTENFIAMENYAKKCNSDFFRLQFPVINFHSLYFEKFVFVDFLERYDRILYLDADVLVTPTAENIFDKYPDSTKFYAYNETDYNQDMDRDFCVTPLLGDCPDWPKDEKNKYRYFNSGVMLISKEHLPVLRDFRNIPNVPGVINIFPDQTYLNYIISKTKTPFGFLDYSFNRMHLGKKDDNCERYKSNFIHYAGPDVYGSGDKFTTIKNDYKKMYYK